MRYAVKRKDGFVWVNPKTGNPEPERTEIDDQEPGFDLGQVYKLTPLAASEAPTAEQPAAAPANRMVTGKSLKRREA